MPTQQLRLVDSKALQTFYVEEWIYDLSPNPSEWHHPPCRNTSQKTRRHLWHLPLSCFSQLHYPQVLSASHSTYLWNLVTFSPITTLLQETGIFPLDFHCCIHPSPYPLWPSLTPTLIYSMVIWIYLFLQKTSLITFLSYMKPFIGFPRLTG